MGARIKYLDLLLDGLWRFTAHFELVASRIGNALASLMRNLGGPNWKVRRLYINVEASVALYGAQSGPAPYRLGRAKRLLRGAMRPVTLSVTRCNLQVTRRWRSWLDFPYRSSSPNNTPTHIGAWRDFGGRKW